MICCAAALAAAHSVNAADSTAPEPAVTRDIIMIQAAPTAIHFVSEDEHVDWSWLVGIEWQRPSRWLLGFAYFNNSFGQKCQYYYAGYSWTMSERNPNWYLKLTGGLLYGYKEPHDTIPLGQNGYAPGAVAGLGYKWNRWNAQVNLLGVAGVMITVGYDLIR